MEHRDSRASSKVLEFKHEHNNEQDKNAVAVMKKGDVVGHIPRALANTRKRWSWDSSSFLTKRESKANVKAVGKAVNRGGGHGIEVPSIHIFFRAKNKY